MATTVQVSDETWQRLNRRRSRPDETFDAIISRTLDETKETNMSKSAELINVSGGERPRYSTEKFDCPYEGKQRGVVSYEDVNDPRHPRDGEVAWCCDACGGALPKGASDTLGLPDDPEAVIEEADDE